MVRETKSSTLRSWDLIKKAVSNTKWGKVANALKWVAKKWAATALVSSSKRTDRLSDAYRAYTWAPKTKYTVIGWHNKNDKVAEHLSKEVWKSMKAENIASKVYKKLWWNPDKIYKKLGY